MATESMHDEIVSALQQLNISQHLQDALIRVVDVLEPISVHTEQGFREISNYVSESREITWNELTALQRENVVSGLLLSRITYAILHMIDGFDESIRDTISTRQEMIMLVTVLEQSFPQLTFEIVEGKIVATPKIPDIQVHQKQKDDK